MRILHVFDHSLPLQSGYVSRSLGIIRGQRARGWDTIHLTTPRHPAGGELREFVDGLSFFRTPKVHNSVPVLRELLEMRSTKSRLEEVVRAEKPDILHAHSPVLNGLPALSVARKFGLPVVYEVRALWEDAAVDLGHTRYGSLRYRASRSLETYAMSRVDKVIALCNPLRTEILERGIARDRVAIVPNAVDSSFLGDSDSSDISLRENLALGKGPVLGFVGSFYAYEGLDILIAAAPLLATHIPNFTILLVGGGPEEGHLHSLVQRMGIERFVRFAGRVHHRDVPRYYDLIDICVFPRRQMRLTDLVTPLKPLEAMARVKPIVASDVGGHRELIADRQTGYLFRAGEVNAMAALLVDVIADPASAAVVARAGRAHVENKLTWDAVADRYASIYEELLANKRIKERGL